MQRELDTSIAKGIYRVCANRMQAKKIILARFSGKGRHTLH